MIAYLRRKQVHDEGKGKGGNGSGSGVVTTIPSLWAGMDNFKGQGPWKFPKPSPEKASPRVTSMVALGLLVSAYFMTGRLASMIELYLYALAGMGLPMSIAMHRSLVVLGGHMAWVLIGSGILGLILRPRPFFGGGDRMYEVESDTDDDDGEDESEDGEVGVAVAVEKKMVKQKYKWYTFKVSLCVCLFC